MVRWQTIRHLDFFTLMYTDPTGDGAGANFTYTQYGIQRAEEILWSQVTR